MLFSLMFPGLGHVFLGKGQRAVPVLAAAVLAFLAVRWTGVLATVPGYLFHLGLELGTSVGLMFDAALGASHPTKVPRWRWLTCLLLGPALLAAVAVAFPSRVLGARVGEMPSGSMSPTLEIRDVFLWDATAYGPRHPPARGDVIVHRFPPEPDSLYVKRAVAFGGEEVRIDDGVLIVDGKTIDEPYLRRGGLAPTHFGPAMVADGTVFVLGDNRARSSDSRSWGPVPMSHVLGRATVVLFSRDGGRFGTPIR